MKTTLTRNADNPQQTRHNLGKTGVGGGGEWGKGGEGRRGVCGG